MRKKERHSLAIDESLSLRLSMPVLLGFLLMVPVVMGAVGDRETFEDDGAGFAPTASWYTFTDFSGGTAAVEVSGADAYRGVRSLVGITSSSNAALSQFLLDAPITPTYITWAMKADCGGPTTFAGDHTMVRLYSGADVIGFTGLRTVDCYFTATRNGLSDYVVDAGLTNGWHEWNVTLDYSGNTYTVAVDDVEIIAAAPADPDMASLSAVWFAVDFFTVPYSSYLDSLGMQVPVPPPDGGGGGGGGGGLAGIGDDLADIFGIGADAGLWIIGLTVVAGVVYLFARFSIAPALMAGAFVLGVAFANVLGVIPDWFLFTVLVLVAAVAALLFRGGGSGQ